MSPSFTRFSSLRAPFGLALITLLIFGLAYSLLATGLGFALFPYEAKGSLITHEGKVVGSALVAQPFSADRYFQPRPSASNYDVMSLSGSNLARTNPELHKRLEQARTAVSVREGVSLAAMPNDLITQSGSGIDPDISPQAAQIQLARVAQARGLTIAQVKRIVERHTRASPLGVLGPLSVNVLALNLALDTYSAQISAK